MSPYTLTLQVRRSPDRKAIDGHVTLDTNHGSVSRPRRMEWLFL